MSANKGLPTRRLGTTDLEITEVGLGAWAIGGGGWAYTIVGVVHAPS